MAAAERKIQHINPDGSVVEVAVGIEVEDYFCFNVTLGKNVAIGDHTKCFGEAKIGNNTRIYPGVEFGHPCPIRADKVMIGDGAKIGPNATIDRDVVIGDGVTIGRDFAAKHDVRIGDRTEIGEYSSIWADAPDDENISPGVLYVRHDTEVQHAPPA